MIVFYRVDDRLVHGQVVEGWLPSEGIDHIIVISDAIAVDSLRQRLLRFATPRGVSLTISNLKEAPAAIRLIEKDSSRAMAIMPSLSEAESLLKAGINIKSLNVGGVIYTACLNMSDGNAVFLGDDDKDVISSIAGKGVSIDCRSMPTDKPIDLLSISARRKPFKKNP